jgi:hypothetical protein
MLRLKIKFARPGTGPLAIPAEVKSVIVLVYRNNVRKELMTSFSLNAFIDIAFTPAATVRLKLYGLVAIFFQNCNLYSIHLSIYLSVCLSVCLSMALQPFAGPWPLFSFLFFTQSGGLLGRGISPSQGRYLHTQNSTNTE